MEQKIKSVIIREMITPKVPKFLAIYGDVYSLNEPENEELALRQFITKYFTINDKKIFKILGDNWDKNMINWHDIAKAFKIRCYHVPLGSMDLLLGYNVPKQVMDKVYKVVWSWYDGDIYPTKMKKIMRNIPVFPIIKGEKWDWMESYWKEEGQKFGSSEFENVPTFEP